MLPFILKNVNQKVRSDPGISIEHFSKEHEAGNQRAQLYIIAEELAKYNKPYFLIALVTH